MEKTPMITEAEEKALQVEKDLAAMHEIKDSWDLDEIREQSQLLYDLIFDGYEDDQENGVTTDKFSLIEDKETQLFTLKQI